MKDSDLGVIVVIYGVGLWFLVMTLQLPDAAQSYPLILIAALLFCNTLLLIKQIYAFIKQKKLTNDLRQIFKGFLPNQFFGVVIGCLIYLAIVNYLGYYLSSVLYLLAAQFFLKVRPIPALISCVCVIGVTYLVFSLFLRVPLPIGLLFE
ncbi:MAG: tripartite tricarboxylate transporter TctB family protein [Burkholderiales bacterium]|nr:tripartite tricarboxylate transporter TctB family protein [Burkholderiales bacterium]